MLLPIIWMEPPPAFTSALLTLLFCDASVTAPPPELIAPVYDSTLEVNRSTAPPAVLMPPAPEIPDARKVTAPALVLMPAVFTIDPALNRAPPAVAVRPAPGVVSAIALSMKMSRPACKVTLPATAARAVGATVTTLPGNSANSSAMEGSSPLTDDTIISNGSSNKLPLAPAAALRLAEPANSRLFFPETSAKPPLPPWGPPCTDRLP